jgi:hypothetical protein
MSRTKSTYDRWRDDRGTHINVGCRVEQVDVDKQYGALSARLGKQGEVVYVPVDHRGNRVHVRFDGEDKPVTIRPHLLRVVVAAIDTVPLTTGHIIDQLNDLRPAPAGDDDHDR